MSNDYAVSRILRRTIDQYDLRRSWFPDEPEAEARHIAIASLARLACIDYVPAAELLADALARRAAKRCKVCGGGHPVGCCAQDGHG